ncbi:MAG TPA: phosphotransferase [Acidimicrobiales bacterium]|nr:phosphotransferase [Acidimicrobiales bacterium]
MTDDPLPASADAIEPAWLSSALTPRFPGVRVQAVEILERHEVTNSHARLRIHYDNAAGAPSIMFAKLPPSDPARRETIAKTNMGRREALFYATLASTLTLRVPDAYVALHDERDGSFLLLLEDLVTTGAAVSDGTWGIAPEPAARALDELAEMHVRFADPARREALAPWVPRASHGSSYGATMLRYGLDHHRDRLSDDFAAVAEIYIDRSDALHALWQEGPATVIHGDPHIGNLFDDHGRAGFLDWGIINVSTPMRDVSYFLNMAMSIEDRRRHERDLLRHYLERRVAAGGSEITFDDAWHAHRIHAAYTVPASCQVVTFPDNATPRRRVFADAFLARAEAALADLEVRSVLRQTAGL